MVHVIIPDGNGGYKTCCVEGCDKPVRTLNTPYCDKHYMRVYRHGSTERQNKAAERKMHSGGYVLVPANGHPLATGRHTSIYEHRKVYYDNHGEGPFNCHHCGVEVTWDTLHIDHLDDNKTNNVIGNLVPSCPVCNQQRGHHKQAQKMRAAGVLLTAFGRTMCVSEWARELGVSHNSINARLKSGWSVERAVSTPRGKFGPKSTKRQPSGLTDG